MTSNPLIFDRRRVRLHRDRAAPQLAEHDFLLRQMGERLAERLAELGSAFPRTLDLGAHTGVLRESMAGQAETLIESDLSAAMVACAAGLRVTADEEFLPFAAETFDLVVSAGALHWVNDLPGALIQIRYVLKPGGLFLAMVPGGQTLRELRQSFERAEMQETGGISPRISPFVDVREAAGLLQRAGFSEPVADSEILTVSYSHPLKLMHDLKGMGESNALLESRKGFTPCSLLMLGVDEYLRAFSDAEGRVPATFELVTMTGWKAG